MTLARIQSPDRIINQLQQNVASQLDPLTNNPTNVGTLLTSISLASGTNVVVTKLSRKLQGWLVVRQRSAATIYDQQDSNQAPESTLILVASAAVVVDLYLF